VFVVHLALTPLAGSPIRIVDALNRHTGIRAQLIVLQTNAYGNRTFDGGIDWQTDREEAIELLHDAHIVHLHHFFELDRNPFNIDFSGECRSARFVRQFHTHPLTIAHGDANRARAIVESGIPQLVIGQYHERFFPKARVVPNIVLLDGELYRPVQRGGTDPVVFFAPTVEYSATSVPQGNTRWETKGAAETEALLLQVVKACGKGRVYVRRNIPHNQCLREKQASDIAIDEMVTGSFHMTSLEALAQGLPTFAYLDSRSLDTLSELTGAHTHPWLNFRLEEAEEPLAELIKDGELRREMGTFARDWMEKYYNDREMVSHYVHAYEDLLERPEAFKKPRFDIGSRRQVFLAQQRDDLVWEKRKTRISSGNSFSCVKPNNPQVVVENRIGQVPNWIKAPVRDLLRKYTSVRVDEVQAVEKRLKATERLLGFVTADETNLWLYVNRQERMDATVDIFENPRREFHLDRYCFAAKRVHGQRVLDCASGTGYGVRLLKEKGRTDAVIGVDVDVNAVAYAFKKHHIEGTMFLCASGDRMPLPDACVDVITSFETIEHVPDDAVLVSEFHRVLRPGGLLIISTPNQWPVTVSPFHLREYDKNTFMKALEAWFECIELYNQNSGTNTPYNHDQPAGIVETTPENELLAECYIAVCRRKS
jgi:ubiquinone/menaquinone biosynthesis C-methylase UbiE